MGDFAVLLREHAGVFFLFYLLGVVLFASVSPPQLSLFSLVDDSFIHLF